MQDLGAYMKHCREERGLDITEVAEQTKIKDYLLVDIEKNDFSRLGGYGFARVTLISYARAVKANLDKALSLFEQGYRADREQRHAFTKSEPQRKLLLPGNILVIIAVVALVVVLSFVVWRLHESGKLDFGMDEVLPVDTTETTIIELPVIASDDQQPEETTPEGQVEEQAPNPDPEPEPEPEPEATPAPVVEQSAAPTPRDTTDYVSRHVFLTEDNPLNVDIESLPGQAQ